MKGKIMNGLVKQSEYSWWNPLGWFFSGRSNDASKDGGKPNSSRRGGRPNSGSRGGKGGNAGDGSFDWQGIGGGVGGGAAGMIAGKYLADLLYPKSEDPEKDSAMDKAIRAAIMLSLSGAGAYGGYKWLKKASDGDDEDMPSIARPAVGMVGAPLIIEAGKRGVGKAFDWADASYLEKYIPDEYIDIRNNYNADVQAARNNHPAAAEWKDSGPIIHTKREMLGKGKDAKVVTTRRITKPSGLDADLKAYNGELDMAKRRFGQKIRQSSGNPTVAVNNPEGKQPGPIEESFERGKIRAARDFTGNKWPSFAIDKSVQAAQAGFSLKNMIELYDAIQRHNETKAKFGNNYP
jgi:hypothetical protein